MTEGTFTLGRNPDGALVFVRVKATGVEILAKHGEHNGAPVRLSKAQIADLIEVLK